MLDGVEVVVDEPVDRRGGRMLASLADTIPAGGEVSKKYTGTRRLLVIYGVGSPGRLAVREKHLAAGGSVAMWDLGYWHRDEAMRLSINSFHPTPEQLARGSGERPRPMVLREDANPTGPILLIGLGRKAAAMYGLKQNEWERAKVAELRRRFPGRRILWRPKAKVFEPLAGTSPRFGMPIETALRGCSLVVCRHSNVAIDACVAGVPVECEEGAARAIYANGQPSVAERAEFLRRLAWWNWRPDEAREAWDWMQVNA